MNSRMQELTQNPDMLEVNNKNLTLAESRSHFTLWCILAAPLMAGNDVQNMSEEIRNILTNKEVIAIYQDPPGKQEYHNTDEVSLKMKITWDHS